MVQLRRVHQKVGEGGFRALDVQVLLNRFHSSLCFQGAFVRISPDVLRDDESFRFSDDVAAIKL